jgi:predicted PurR-regulated permease PerM
VSRADTDRPRAAAPPPVSPAPPRERRRNSTAWARVGPGPWLRAGFFVGLGLIAAVATANAVWSVRDVLVKVLVAAFLAVSLEPAVRWLVGRGIRRGLAVTVIFGVFVAVLASFLISVIPAVTSQFSSLTDNVPIWVAQLQSSERLRGLNERFDLANRLAAVAGTLPGVVTGGLLGFTRALFGALANLLTVIVFVIYFMLDMPRLRWGVTRLVPAQGRAHFTAVTDLVIDKVGAYMIGQLLIALVAGVCAFAALELLRVAFPVPLAVMVAVTALIPLIGATLGAVVAVVLTALTAGIWPTAVVLLVFFIVYQQVENYLIAPRIQRSAVNLSAAAVLLAGLIGATALGLLGALMAIPTAAALKVIVLERLDEQDRATDAEPGALVR